jgi:hypothetical protein
MNFAPPRMKSAIAFSSLALFEGGLIDQNTEAPARMPSALVNDGFGS